MSGCSHGPMGADEKQIQFISPCKGNTAALNPQSRSCSDGTLTPERFTCGKSCSAEPLQESCPSQHQHQSMVARWFEQNLGFVSSYVYSNYFWHTVLIYTLYTYYQYRHFFSGSASLALVECHTLIHSSSEGT